MSEYLEWKNLETSEKENITDQVFSGFEIRKLSQPHAGCIQLFLHKMIDKP